MAEYGRNKDKIVDDYINRKEGETEEEFWDRKREETWDEPVENMFERMIKMREEKKAEYMELIRGICKHCSSDANDVVSIEVWWDYKTFLCKRCKHKW